MFAKVLIANRGEIACRTIATCRRLGIVTAAVYSDADAGAMHVRLADEAYRLGPAPARASYLDIERVLDAARASGAQAIHPGYGFLAESPQFAESVAAAGLVFIGPPVAAMRAMSSKASARALMQRSQVPILPGYQGEQQDAAYLRVQAALIGYPVLLKPAAGGGGKGMRVVSDAASFEANLAACQREAAAAFGDARVVLEKYLPAPRHVEVQVFGDQGGRIVHLYERDCSAQRRHQKVLEEAPAPGLTAAQRSELTAAACEAARAVGYTGAGTVEFLLDAGGRCYFIEMNTRIQVEHAVTEMVTGVDLVEWQLRIAAGEPLPLTQQQIGLTGHAIEARLYAEVPEAGFLPSGGTLRRFDLPPATAALRLETGVQSGDSVGIDYDPMLAKLIVRGGDRLEALAALAAALSQVRISGVGNNLLFLRRLLASAAVRAGGIDTGFIERELAALTGAVDAAPAAQGASMALAAAALWTLERERQAAAQGQAGECLSPWQRADGWRVHGTLSRTLCFESGIEVGIEVGIEYRVQGPRLAIGGQLAAAQLLDLGNDQFSVSFGQRSARVQILEDAGQLRIGVGLDQYRLRVRDPLEVSATAQSVQARLAAPMPGRIIAQLVRAGEPVTKGTALLILEAMKMEHTLCAPADGTVRAYRAAVGSQVQEGTQLVDFEPRS
ncbi:MAG TPA: biotin carboxylase N-terminal domain-containing protein [Steroidobacteraceae bacterium]|jgi:3-methylcrotonyl-CoA carboxylase alpha subunit|nr:biotin carboxylase N-terminal domain-containing protein [Steroidobacteraceae bacterium]